MNSILKSTIAVLITVLIMSCDFIPDTVPPDDNAFDPLNPDSIYNTAKLPPAAGISFYDEDTSEDIISGSMTVSKAADETAVTGYRLYWGSDSTTKLPGAPLLKEIEKTGGDIELNWGGAEAGSITSTVPAGATHILVYTYYADKEADTPFSYDIEDRVVEMTADMLTDSGASYPQELTVFNDKLYFVSRITSAIMQYNLWEYDDTKVVSMVSGDQTLWNPRLIPVNGTAGYSNPSDLSVINNLLYFVGDQQSATYTNQLCSLSTSRLVTLVTDVDLAVTSGTELVPFTVGSTGDIFFRGFNTTVRNELFRTNHISLPGSNTANVIDLNPGTAEGYASWLTLMNGKLYFSATDGVNGTEIWAYDGTAAPTAGVNVNRLTDINSSGDSLPQYLTAYKNKIYFAANDSGNNTELYSVDDSGVEKITSGTHSFGSIPVFLKVINDTLYFTAWDNSDKRRLWSYSGSGSPQAIVFPDEAQMTASSALCEHDGNVYAEANDAVHGTELWCYDGTTSRLVADINAGTGNGLSGVSMASYNGRLYFSANDGSYGEELWVYYVK